LGIVGGIIDDVDKINIDFEFQKSIILRAENLNDLMAFPEKYLQEIGKELGILLLSNCKFILATCQFDHSCFSVFD
jgi:hypothetical protein